STAGEGRRESRTEALFHAALQLQQVGHTQRPETEVAQLVQPLQQFAPMHASGIHKCENLAASVERLLQKRVAVFCATYQIV
ncbi:hypothetical protein GNI_009870, partial [Gregarina niphandrodes]